MSEQNKKNKLNKDDKVNKKKDNYNRDRAILIEGIVKESDDSLIAKSIRDLMLRDKMN